MRNDVARLEDMLEALERIEKEKLQSILGRMKPPK